MSKAASEAIQALFVQLKAAGWEHGITSQSLEGGGLKFVTLEDHRPFGPSIKFYFKDGLPWGFSVIGQNGVYHV